MFKISVNIEIPEKENNNVPEVNEDSGEVNKCLLIFVLFCADLIAAIVTVLLGEVFGWIIIDDRKSFSFVDNFIRLIPVSLLVFFFYFVPRYVVLCLNRTFDHDLYLYKMLSLNQKLKHKCFTFACRNISDIRILGNVNNEFHNMIYDDMSFSLDVEKLLDVRTNPKYDHLHPFATSDKLRMLLYGIRNREEKIKELMGDNYVPENIESGDLSENKSEGFSGSDESEDLSESKSRDFSNDEVLLTGENWIPYQSQRKLLKKHRYDIDMSLDKVDVLLKILSHKELRGLPDYFYKYLNFFKIKDSRFWRKVDLEHKHEITDDIITKLKEFNGVICGSFALAMYLGRNDARSSIVIYYDDLSLFEKDSEGLKEIDFFHQERDHGSHHLFVRQKLVSFGMFLISLFYISVPIKFFISSLSLECDQIIWNPKLENPFSQTSPKLLSRIDRKITFFNCYYNNEFYFDKIVEAMALGFKVIPVYVERPWKHRHESMLTNCESGYFRIFRKDVYNGNRYFERLESRDIYDAWFQYEETKRDLLEAQIFEIMWSAIWEITEFKEISERHNMVREGRIQLEKEKGTAIPKLKTELIVEQDALDAVGKIGLLFDKSIETDDKRGDTYIYVDKDLNETIFGC